jgi:hypothetical protein
MLQQFTEKNLRRLSRQIERLASHPGVEHVRAGYFCRLDSNGSTGDSQR